MALQRYEEAVAACECALRLNTRNDIAYNNKTVALLHLRRYEDALGTLKQALRLFPNEGEFHYHEGDALAGLGRIQEAEKAYDQAPTWDIHDSSVYLSVYEKQKMI